MKRKDYPKATERFKRTQARAASQPKAGPAWLPVSMGAMLAAHGELRAAREHLEEALRIDPRLPEARELLRRMQGRN
jgi:predicted Zn-dependent protease